MNAARMDRKAASRDISDVPEDAGRSTLFSQSNSLSRDIEDSPPLPAHVQAIKPSVPIPPPPPPPLRQSLALGLQLNSKSADAVVRNSASSAAVEAAQPEPPQEPAASTKQNRSDEIELSPAQLEKYGWANWLGNDLERRLRSSGDIVPRVFAAEAGCSSATHFTSRLLEDGTRSDGASFDAFLDYISAQVLNLL